jgi:hypothetical protein
MEPEPDSLYKLLMSIDNNDFEIIKNTLVFINKIIQRKTIKWVLGGSTNLALQGVNVIPHDIDILTNKDGAFAIQKKLSGYCVQKIEYCESDFFKSWFGVFKINGIKIEVMGDLSTRSSYEDDWQEPTNLVIKKHIVLENQKIPVKTLEEELWAYSKMGRIEKAEKIKNAINRQKL